MLELKFEFYNQENSAFRLATKPSYFFSPTSVLLYLIDPRDTTSNGLVRSEQKAFSENISLENKIL